MLLKAPDDKSQFLAELDRLATVPPRSRKRQIAEESRIFRAGIKGEQESACLLDFQLAGRCPSSDSPPDCAVPIGGSPILRTAQYLGFRLTHRKRRK
jgi:hypothetical protein